MKNQECIKYMLNSAKSYEGFFYPNELIALSPKYTLCGTVFNSTGPNNDLKISS